MTVQEKLAAMEALWEDLSRSPEAIESPEWHSFTNVKKPDSVGISSIHYFPI
jgi:hypothetical protein